MTLSAVSERAAMFHAGGVLSAVPYGSGHINDTYLVETAKGRFILQRINTKVFSDPYALTENLMLVTSHIRMKTALDGGDFERCTITPVPAVGGAFCAEAEDGFWRMSRFIDGSFSLDRAERPEDTYEGGRGFGRFMTLLRDFPAERLHETIPNFHNTPLRLEAMKRSAEEDAAGRLLSCAGLYEEYASRAEFYASEWRRLDAALPKRVTHNDTKINNILFDSATRRALAVIDLDTVMPGLSVFDFGDAIRTGAASADEDTTAPETMGVSTGLFEAYARGYLEEAEGLTPEETESLVLGAKMMTYECGSRFMADYLAGDVYFKASRPSHNLDRAASQMALLQDMERRTDELEETVRGLVRARG